MMSSYGFVKADVAWTIRALLDMAFRMCRGRTILAAAPVRSFKSAGLGTN